MTANDNKHKCADQVHTIIFYIYTVLYFMGLYGAP